MNLNDHSESNLLQLLKSGNADEAAAAFDALYRRHQSKVLMKVIITLHNEAEAKDILQDVFFSLWNNRRQLTIEVSLKAYLMTTAKNKCLDLLRRKTTQANYQKTLPSELTTDPHTEKIETDDQQKAYYQALEQISNPVSKQVLNLYFTQGLSHHETGQKLGISEIASRSHVFRALQQLRKIYKKK